MGYFYNKIEIDSSIDTVWDTMSNFHDMSWAPNVITDVTNVGDKKGNELGSKRVLNDAFHETLTALDPSAHTFSYSIDNGPGPLSNPSLKNYIGTVKLTPAERGTLVEWSSSYDSENESEIEGFCNPIYLALLADLKKTLS